MKRKAVAQTTRQLKASTPKRSRGRPRKLPSDADAIARRFERADTAKLLDAVIRELGAATIKGLLGARRSEAAQGWARLKLQVLKVAAMERAARELSAKAVVLTDEELDGVLAARAAYAVSPLKPGEGVPPSEDEDAQHGGVVVTPPVSPAQ